MAKKKRGKLILVLVAVAIVCLCVTRYQAVHKAEETEAVESMFQAEVAEVEEELPEAVGSSLSDRQIELIEGYTEKEAEIIDFLKGNSWQTSDSLRTIQFADDNYMENDLSSETTGSPVTFAIAATGNSVQTTQDATTELTLIVMECGDGETRMMTLGKTTQLDGTVNYVLSSSDFKVATSYLRFDRATNVEVKGMTETMMSYIGGDLVPLERALTDYCKTFCPSAQSATWEQVVTLDDAAGTVSFSLMLDVSETPSVAVLYTRETGVFEVGRSR